MNRLEKQIDQIKKNLQTGWGKKSIVDKRREKKEECDKIEKKKTYERTLREFFDI